MSTIHQYHIKTVWEGNKGSGTSGVLAYDRSHSISNVGKPTLSLTTDNAKVGDKSKLNPEDLLVSAVASCHMLSYLYLCAMEGVVITSYEDQSTGTMVEELSGGGKFKEVTLNPVTTVAHKDMVHKALMLHHKAHEICYIANSVNFEVKHNASCTVAG